MGLGILVTSLVLWLSTLANQTSVRNRRADRNMRRTKFGLFCRATYKIKLIIDSWADVLDSKGHNDTQTFLSRKSTEVISAPGRKRLMRKEQFARNLVSDLAKREGSSTITIHVQVARKSVGIKHAKPPMMNPYEGVGLVHYKKLFRIASRWRARLGANRNGKGPTA